MTFTGSLDRTPSPIFSIIFSTHDPKLLTSPKYTTQSYSLARIIYSLHYSDLPSLISLGNSYSAFKTPVKKQLPWISPLSSERMKRFFLCSHLCVHRTMVSIVPLSSPSNCMFFENIPRPRIMPSAWETVQTFDELINFLKNCYIQPVSTSGLSLKKSYLSRKGQSWVPCQK